MSELSKSRQQQLERMQMVKMGVRRVSLSSVSQSLGFKPKRKQRKPKKNEIKGLKAIGNVGELSEIVGDVVWACLRFII